MAASKALAACAVVFLPEATSENSLLMDLSASSTVHCALAGVARVLRAPSKKPFRTAGTLVSALTLPTVLFGFQPSCPKIHLLWMSGLAAIFVHCSARFCCLLLAATPQTAPPSMTGWASPLELGSGKVPRSASLIFGLACLIWLT